MASSYNHLRGTHSKAELSRLNLFITSLYRLTEGRLCDNPDCWVTQGLFEQLQKEREQIIDAYNDACYNPSEDD